MKADIPRVELKVQDVVNLHAVPAPDGTLWVHTHGLAKYGYPDLEIRDLPFFMVEGAARLLNSVGQYMLANKACIKADENMQSGSLFLHFVEPEPFAGTEDHYEVERLQIVDPPGITLCDGCKEFHPV